MKNIFLKTISLFFIFLLFSNCFCVLATSDCKTQITTNKVEYKEYTTNKKIEKQKNKKEKHVYSRITTKKATPLKNGYEIYKCENCNKIKKKTIKFNFQGKNNLYIPSIKMNKALHIGNCDQKNTDNYDITCSLTKLGEKDPVVFGHNTRSLSVLHNVKVGSYIYLTINEKTTLYKVTHSEIGKLTDDETNIKGVKTGKKVIFTSNGSLHIFTCHYSSVYGKCRWIVIAKKIK